MSSISSISTQAAAYTAASQSVASSQGAGAQAPGVPATGSGPAATVQISAQARQLAAQSADKDHDGDSK